MSSIKTRCASGSTRPTHSAAWAPAEAYTDFDALKAFVLTHPLGVQRRSCVEARNMSTGIDLEGDDITAGGWPLTRQPYMFETTVPRVFAVGDVRRGSVKRVAAAVGEGSACVQLVHKVLAE